MLDDSIIQENTSKGLKIAFSDKMAFNSEETSQILGINRNLLDSFRRSGIIVATKVGRYYIYSKKELERFLKDSYGKEITKNGVIVGG